METAIALAESEPPKLELLIPLVPDFVGHVSLKCEGCPERLEFSFTEEEDAVGELDYSMFQNGWERRMDGLYCSRCAPSVEYHAVL
jgi:hypothetical protein